MNQVSIEMAAAGALDGLRGIIVAKKQSLYFAQLERAENAAQSGDAAGIAAGLVDGFANRFLAAAVLSFGENFFGFAANRIASHMNDVGGKPAQQPLRNVGMQLCRELRPMSVLAAEDPLLEGASIFTLIFIVLIFSFTSISISISIFIAIFSQGIHEELRETFEVLAGLIGDAPLGVTSVIAGEAIAAAAAGERLEESLTLGQFAETQIEQTSTMTVEQHDSETRKGSQQAGQRLEVEMAVDEKLSARELGGQIIFAPEALRRAGEYRLGMSSVTA